MVVGVLLVPLCVCVCVCLGLTPCYSIALGSYRPHVVTRDWPAESLAEAAGAEMDLAQLQQEGPPALRYFIQWQVLPRCSFQDSPLSPSLIPTVSV